MATITDYDYDENPYVTCPYFPEHTLPRSRLAYHLVKCQKNPNAPKLLACPFNYLHRVRPEDKRRHLEVCEDRESYLAYSKSDKSKRKEGVNMDGANSAMFNEMADDSISEEKCE